MYLLLLTLSQPGAGRFYDPQQGTLWLDGVDMRQIDHTFLHQQVALVAQEPLVFAESIEYNITFGVHRSVTKVCDSMCWCSEDVQDSKESPCTQPRMSTQKYVSPVCQLHGRCGSGQTCVNVYTKVCR